MRVLLVTAHGPYAPVWGENLHDLFAARLTRGQGMFSFTSHWHAFGLHLIAENLRAPTTVLEEPSLEDFTRELAQGYDVVGFQLMSRHSVRVAAMAEAVKKALPRARVVLGGFGAAALADDVPNDPEKAADRLRAAAHHVCREDGVSYMRALLGEPPGPVVQRSLPMAGFSMRGFSRRYMRVPVVLAALGCPNGCSFCNTSAYAGRRKVSVADPEEAVAALEAQAARLGGGAFLSLVFDEDIFSDLAWVRRFGALLKARRERWGWKWFGFGSVRSLSALSAEEVRELGCGALWTGVESFAEGGAPGEEALAKRAGDPAKVVRALHEQGVLVVASMALGFDGHTRASAERDVDAFVRLRPPFYQVAPLNPCPGTPLYARLKMEGRLDPTYRWEDFHLFRGDWASHPNLAPGETRELFELAHRRLAAENGPPFLGMLEGFLNARRAWGRGTDAHARRQVELYTGLAALCRALLAPIAEHAAGPGARARAAELAERAQAELGSPTLVGRVMAGLASWNLARAARRDLSTPPSYAPPTRWTYYNQDPQGRVLVRKGRGGKARPLGRHFGVFG
ncbi:hypothetical protein EPO15_02815 [bacterium]|nr:MAG: hypothetical protein EPO15_02815 [bacterium]